jgi:hypothetical protein
MQTDAEVLSQIRDLIRAVSARANSSAPDEVKTKLNAAREELDALGGRSGASRGAGGPSNLTALNRELSRVFEIVQGSDHGPTTQAVSAVHELRKTLDAQLSKWKGFQTTTLVKLNSVLRDAKLDEITVPKPDLDRLKGAGSESFDGDVDEP